MDQTQQRLSNDELLIENEPILLRIPIWWRAMQPESACCLEPQKKLNQDTRSHKVFETLDKFLG